MSAAHTATPFHCKKLVGVTERGFALFSTAVIGTGITTHRLDKNLNGEFSEADAEFIVRACNAHDDLVAALSAAKDWHNADDWKFSSYRHQQEGWQKQFDLIEAALAKAGAA